jgi:exonuclease III
LSAINVNETTNLTVWYTNATSLNNKIDELRLLVNIHKPDVVCVTETWFKLESDVNINSYNIFRLDRPTHGGGVCIYVRNNITSNESNLDRLNKTDIEQIWTRLCLGEQKLLIGCIYRPPGSTSIVNNLIIESIVSAKKSIYQKLYSDIIITGDFNFNTIDWSNPDCPYVSDSNARSFIDCLDECFLTQCVTKFQTYISKSKLRF